MTSQTSLVFAGAAVLDTIALVSRFPQPDERLLADDITTGGGGPAATAAITAARLGLPVAFVGAVGADEDGRRLLDELHTEHIDTSGVSVITNARSAASVVLVDSRRDTRAICTRPGPTPHLNDAARQLLGDAAWVHVDHLGFNPVREFLHHRPDTAGPRLSLDAGNPIEGLRLPGIDLFVPTLSALVHRYGDPGADPSPLLDAALAEGARQVVATRGAGGCLAATADGERHAVPGHSVDAVSTLGAGDVFHGALLAAVARGMEFGEGLRYACATAALSCRALDGRSAIPTHDEVLGVLPAAVGDH